MSQVHILWNVPPETPLNGKRTMVTHWFRSKAGRRVFQYLSQNSQMDLVSVGLLLMDKYLYCD